MRQAGVNILCLLISVLMGREVRMSVEDGSVSIGGGRDGRGGKVTSEKELGESHDK